MLSVSLNGKDILAMPRDIQREPVKRYLEHVDLIVITPEEATARTAFGVKATADAAEALAANEAARAAEAPEAPAAEAEAQ